MTKSVVLVLTKRSIIKRKKETIEIIKELFPIRVSVNREIKAVQFWLTAAEREDNSVMSAINDYAVIDKKYKKVIYVSGVNSLAATTGDLLKRNRIVS